MKETLFKIIHILLFILGIIFLSATLSLIFENLSGAFIGAIFTFLCLYFPMKSFFSQENKSKRKLKSMDKQLEQEKLQSRYNQELINKKSEIEYAKKKNIEYLKSDNYIKIIKDDKLENNNGITQQDNINSNQDFHQIKCPRCNSEKISISINSTQQIISKKQGRGCLYWLFIGWWLELFLWLFLTIPRLLILIFVPKKQKIEVKTNTRKIAVCQKCGFSWNVNN